MFFIVEIHKKNDIFILNILKLLQKFYNYVIIKFKNKKRYYLADKGKVYDFAGVSTLWSRPGFPIAMDLRDIHLYVI